MFGFFAALGAFLTSGAATGTAAIAVGAASSALAGGIIHAATGGDNFLEGAMYGLIGGTAAGGLMGAGEGAAVLGPQTSAQVAAEDAFIAGGGGPLGAEAAAVSAGTGLSSAVAANTVAEGVKGPLASMQPGTTLNASSMLKNLKDVYGGMDWADKLLSGNVIKGAVEGYGNNQAQKNREAEFDKMLASKRATVPNGNGPLRVAAPVISADQFRLSNPYDNYTPPQIGDIYNKYRR